VSPWFQIAERLAPAPTCLYVIVYFFCEHKTCVAVHSTTHHVRLPLVPVRSALKVSSIAYIRSVPVSPTGARSVGTVRVAWSSERTDVLCMLGTESRSPPPFPGSMPRKFA